MKTLLILLTMPLFAHVPCEEIEPLKHHLTGTIIVSSIWVTIILGALINRNKRNE